MRLRIVSGILSRKYIVVEKKAQNFRPTQERVRQAVCETIKTRIADAKVADLCAGSGAFGFECISRGAASVDFVENDDTRARCIRRHCGLFAIEDLCRVFRQDVRRFIPACDTRYDIIYYDPPYEERSLALLVADLTGLLSDNGLLIYERDSSSAPAYVTTLPPPYGRKERVYGDTAVDYISAI